MPLVRYTGNSSYSDGTGAVQLEGGRTLTLNGPPLELSDQEISKLQGRFVLEVVGEDAPEPAVAADAPTQPVVPQSPATPSASVSTPNTLTPSAGN